MNDLINIENKILVIRGQQVMLDRDLAELYGVETKRINEQVRRNIERFPEQFCFQLTKQESVICSKSQIATLNERGNLRGTNIKKYPYVFTEQGVAMLSAVLRSKIAISVSIKIMNAFVLMRHYFQANLGFEQRLDSLERHKIETDNKFDTLFSLMDKYKIEDKQGIFYQGQIFDAYSFFQNLIQKAQKEIILIDNYIDFTVLERLTKKQPGVDVTIFTKSDSPITQLEISKFNKQYPPLTITHTSSMHDRFLIIDNTEIYHIGASIKDLGKKCFAFTKLEDAKSVIKEVLQRI
ncbi:MAG: ORF6N domain-containing protein [Spirochaetia bacterium]|nr:ORF6N domain-containing protein [Spirochaetia bacterium]